VSEKKRFTSFAALRDWWSGRGDQEDDKPADSAPTYGESDEDADEPVDECPMGGEHDIVEIGAATNQGKPLLRYCRRCREGL
jgi:hypothetical protein